MPAGLTVAVQYGLYAGSLAPAGGAFVARQHGRALPAGAALFAAAMAVSFVGDTATLLADRQWLPTSIWMTVQVGLALTILLRPRERVWWWLVLIALAVVDVAITGPDVLLRVAGGTAVVFFTLRRRHPLAPPLLLYFGLATLLYVTWVAAIPIGDPIPWWWAYQSARVLAWIAFAALLTHSPE